MTGLVILVTGAWTSGASGAALSGAAFETGLPGTWGDLVVTVGLDAVRVLDIIGWSYYGETGIVYLVGAARPCRTASSGWCSSISAPSARCTSSGTSPTP